MEEIVLAHLLCLRVVADEDQVDLLVVPRQEQVEQDEEALGQILACLVHRAGDVHQAEHHRLGCRHRHADAAAVTQVDRIKIRDARDARAQRSDRGFELLDARQHGVVLRAGDQAVEFFFELAHLTARTRADGDAPADGAAHRAHHMQVVGRAVAAVAGALAFPFGRFGKLRAHQVGQGQVVEEDLHELFLAQAEDEVVLAFAGIAGLLPGRCRNRRRPWAARCGRRG